MSQEIPKIAATRRDQLGSRYSKRLRKGGGLPAVIYGHQLDPMHITIDRRQVADLLHRRVHVVEVQHDAKSEPCLIKDVQWDHLGADLLHLDLTRVDLTERVTTEVGLELTGEPAGLKEAGAVLETHLTSLEIECQVINIPQSIKVDVSHLKPDETLKVADLKLPEGVTCPLDPETIIAAITVLSAEPEPEVAAEEVTAEPEVIGRKVEEPEGEEAPEEKKKK